MSTTVDQQLELPEQAVVKALCPDILMFDGVIPWGESLIELSEEINVWADSKQVSAYGDQSFTSDYRSSNGTYVSVACDERWRPYEAGLYSAFLSCVAYYKQYNGFLEVNADTGYELLRYSPGQKFDCHVDTVSGRTESGRQLTGLAYLNDDFIGGHTIFPRQCVSVKPKAGSILLFPSNFCFPHKGDEVIQGTKYAIVTWFVGRVNSK